eukprot:SAG11_NODE_33293_length_278_cov_0.581006_1_plen_59_part_10
MSNEHDEQIAKKQRVDNGAVATKGEAAEEDVGDEGQNALIGQVAEEAEEEDEEVAAAAA